MHRSHTCGELRIENVGQEVNLAGWVQRTRDMGGMTFVDLRDRYGITQLSFSIDENEKLCSKARKLGREFVVKATGKVVERESKNPKLETGDVEILVTSLKVFSPSEVPPFTIEDETDGGEELRMRYRYLDLRRKPLLKNLKLRHQLALETRKFLDQNEFMEIETPYLIKSTPEGARDFVVPSRMHGGEFYALPQSPQTFKQLLMIGGYDRYFQIVRCFRDEDLRADRQPEFTQIDCEMAFVEQEDVLQTFEGLMKHFFKEIKGVDLPEFPRMTYADAMARFGSDKPDTRFGMEFVELNDTVQKKGFKVFDDAELVVGVCAEGAAGWSRKQLDALTDFVRRPQVGAQGLIYCKHNEDGTFKSSVDKFFDQNQLNSWASKFDSKPGDLMLVLAGPTNKVRKQLNELRLYVGGELGLRNPDEYSPLWVVDFPLFEQDEETGDFHAMHHPFTSPKADQMGFLESSPGSVNANAYDMVINGVELGGGSIRIHDEELQKQMFRILGFSDEEAKAQFGFLMGAFKYGAPPHGGIAFGFDRIAALFGGTDSIRDYIAFPKNNAGRDLMIDSPSEISDEQLKELHLQVKSES
ncbi:MAG: aspartate--tRNA ligase [Flavobacteriales bacterium]|jgi:aspartyl-tRNA synthetase|nr:aspartate--tRNA ligase [Flavobacteriales bacterium]NCG28995.1 aspartate--tRNA ligase [Bacteroidota bacterium]MBT3963465.1 aspartate--tRNA ligase [Flavobacteriales bacterium]MBT4706020.1 aspartate--tRNA ligase [Flavobacteriales bacterium]MBT4931458.1 aspartate--tRNA ligase [Flavobacteriales bacterium]